MDDVLPHAVLSRLRADALSSDIGGDEMHRRVLKALATQIARRALPVALASAAMQEGLPELGSATIVDDAKGHDKSGASNSGDPGLVVFVARLVDWLEGNGRHEMRKAKRIETRVNAAAEVIAPLIDGQTIAATKGQLAHALPAAVADQDPCDHGTFAWTLCVPPTLQPLLYGHLELVLAAARMAAQKAVGCRGGGVRVKLPARSKAKRNATHQWRLEVRGAADADVARRALDAAVAALSPIQAQLPAPVSPKHLIGCGGFRVNKIVSDLERAIQDQVKFETELTWRLSLVIDAHRILALVLLLPRDSKRQDSRRRTTCPALKGTPLTAVDDLRVRVETALLSTLRACTEGVVSVISNAKLAFLDQGEAQQDEVEGRWVDEEPLVVKERAQLKRHRDARYQQRHTCRAQAKALRMARNAHRHHPNGPAISSRASRRAWILFDEGWVVPPLAAHDATE